MKRNVININSYKYLIEYYDADLDMSNNQYCSEFVMFRNFTITNNIVCDTDIYIVEKNHLNEYIEELRNNNTTFGNTISFPVTNIKTNSYSNSYVKFNDNYNVNILGKNSSIYIEDLNGNVSLGSDVYEIYVISNNKLYSKSIKCDKFRIYHPITKKNLNAIIDINNYINNIHFHYLCRPMSLYNTNSETEIKYNNETYSEFVEVYFPNMHDLFKINEDGSYDTFYKEDFNIVASTRNEKFINSLLSSSKELEHSEFIDNCQIVPMNLLIQPYRIIEEYDVESEFNYDNDVSNDKKIFVKLFLKTNTDINNNYLSFPISLRLYPYSYVDQQTKLYILDDELAASAVSLNSEFKFNLMSRLGFSDGIISLVSLFTYPNKSYFYNKYKDDYTTSPIKEAYKYYNNVDDHNYLMFINEDIEKELEDIDAIDTLTTEMKQTVKEVANVNYVDEGELLKTWKDIMKSTIIQEYEEEFGTPGNFLGFKIDIATDINFTHIIYTKNVRVNFGDIDDFAFKLNGIFERWEQKPEKLIIRCSFYDRVIGVEIKSNLVIITKEWFRYLINNVNVYRLSNISNINKEKGKLDNMKVIDLKNNNINFINTINCVINKKNENTAYTHSSNNQKIIFKPIFYKVNNLQNISLISNFKQNIAINLSEYLSKVETFKLIIENKEYVESGRTDIFVIFNIDSNDISNNDGKYHIVNEDGTYISSGNWAKN